MTLLVLGGPLWGYHWTAAQRRLRREGQGERGSLERRLFIFAALGAGAAALLASASTLLFYLFRDALAGDLSMDTLESAKIAVAAIAAVAILLPYYWLVYLRDQREMRPEREPPPRKAVSVLAGDGGQAFARRLEDALGYRVSLLRWADVDAGFPELTDAEVEELLRRISGAPGQSVLLVPSGGAVRVLSYGLTPLNLPLRRGGDVGLLFKSERLPLSPWERAGVWVTSRRRGLGAEGMC